MKKSHKKNRGNRREQQRRRRQNNKSIKKQEYEYQLIDGNFSSLVCAYCVYYKGYLTNNQLIRHTCKQRECVQLKSLEWAFENNKR